MIDKFEIENDRVKFYIRNKDGVSFECQVDLIDWDRIKNIPWHLTWRENIQGYYICCNEGYHDENGKYRERSVLLHRFITNAKKGEFVDHYNHNTRDNIRKNLRVTSNARNLSHRNGANKNSGTGVRNVNWIESANEYWVQIMKNGKRYKWIFPSNQFDKACKFAEEKRKELFGDYRGH